MSGFFIVEVFSIMGFKVRLSSIGRCVEKVNTS